jgi:amidase
MLSTPTEANIAAICESLGITVDAAEVAVYRDLVEGSIAGCALVDDMPDETAEWTGSERSWQRPAAADNPFNAWYVTTLIAGSPDGPLAGRTVAIKDNVLVGGVPLMNGTSILEGYVPPVDATIVTRILEAGGTIAGKSVCEAYCFSGGSHTASSGFVTNPHDASRAAGGSSSGSGALVAGGVVDMAIGCDQGGSIRMPASFCGVVGMKPTHGLVPYTGILGMGPAIDHAGPMTANVHDNALLLEVIAGADGLDSRQYAPRVEAYSEQLAGGVKGMRIGVLREGFGGDDSEADVDSKVRAAADRFSRLGADVSEVSVPLHAVGPAICFSVIQSTVETIFGHDGALISRLDPAVASLVAAQHGWRDRADELPANVKVMLMSAEYLRREHGWEYVAKGGNQIRRLRAAYDAVLGDVDVLLLPTTPMKATELPGPDADPATVLGLAFAPLGNTMAFNNTHHPAISLPCAMSNGLPVGMMLVGRHFEESLLYRAALAFEQHEDWRQL